MPGDALVSSRRERLRAETTAEIKSRAWALMAQTGPQVLSLREIARQMGMAPSALYRYFAGRDDLLTALIVDGFSSLGETIRVEYERLRREQPELAGVEVFVRVCFAYRRWALANRTEWALIFSSPVPDYQGTEETTMAATSTSDVLTRIMADVVADGDIDVEGLDAGVDPALRPALQEWSNQSAYGLPPGVLEAALWCYAALHGAIALELNGHLPPSLSGTDALFDSTIRSAVRSLRPHP